MENDELSKMIFQKEEEFIEADSEIDEDQILQKYFTV
jgi:hypothetical protein